MLIILLKQVIFHRVRACLNFAFRHSNDDVAWKTGARQRAIGIHHLQSARRARTCLKIQGSCIFILHGLMLVFVVAQTDPAQETFAPLT